MLYRTLAEIMGLAPGFCKGRGGSMHLRWAEAGALGTNAIVGGGVPLANGAAWACKRRGAGDVVFTFLGDGAVNIGAVPESLNLAALWSLPICFFIENNGYAVSTTVAEETRETRLSSRGGAYGIPALRVDGMDPVAVRLAAQMAPNAMRTGRRPVHHRGRGLSLLPPRRRTAGQRLRLPHQGRRGGLARARSADVPRTRHDRAPLAHRGRGREAARGAQAVSCRRSHPA